MLPNIGGGNDDSGKSGTTVRLATLGDRMIAIALDSILLLALLALTDFLLLKRWNLVSAGEVKLTVAAVLLGGSLNLLISFLYLWLMEAGFGATLGKAMIGIGVVNQSDRSALAASAIRNLLRAVDGIGFYLVGALVATCSKFRRRIGDLCAGTYVIEGQQNHLWRIAAVAVWLVVLTGSAWTLPRMRTRLKPTTPPKYFSQTVLQVGRSENSIYMQGAHLRMDMRVGKSEQR